MIQSKNKYNELDGYIVAGTTNEYMYMPNDIFHLIGYELIPNNYNNQNNGMMNTTDNNVINNNQVNNAGPRFCTNCGTKIGNNASFCTNCGTKVN